MANANIPDTFNGQKTKYELFDGFKNASTIGKVVYVGSILAAFFSFGASIGVPVVIEICERLSADKAAVQALVFQQQERTAAKDKPAPAYTVTPQEAQELEDRMSANKRNHTEAALSNPAQAASAAR